MRQGTLDQSLLRGEHDSQVELGYVGIIGGGGPEGGRLRLRSRNSSRTHVQHAFGHLRTFCGIFTKRCVFIVLMTIASDPPNSAFSSEKYYCFGNKKISNLVKVF